MNLTLIDWDRCCRWITVTHLVFQFRLTSDTYVSKYSLKKLLTPKFIVHPDKPFERVLRPHWTIMETRSKNELREILLRTTLEPTSVLRVRFISSMIAFSSRHRNQPRVHSETTLRDSEFMLFIRKVTNINFQHLFSDSLNRWLLIWAEILIYFFCTRQDNGVF